MGTFRTEDGGRGQIVRPLVSNVGVKMASAASEWERKRRYLLLCLCAERPRQQHNFGNFCTETHINKPEIIKKEGVVTRGGARKRREGQPGWGQHFGQLLVLYMISYGQGHLRNTVASGELTPTSP